MAIDEAIQTYYMLSEPSSGRRADLARALTNLSMIYRDLGRQDAALKAADIAFELGGNASEFASLLVGLKPPAL